MSVTTIYMTAVITSATMLGVLNGDIDIILPLLMGILYMR